MAKTQTFGNILNETIEKIGKRDAFIAYVACSETTYKRWLTNKTIPAGKFHKTINKAMRLKKFGGMDIDIFR